MTNQVLSAAVVAALAGAAMGQNIGPSTTVAPHVLPARSGVSTTSILTVGDSAANGYRLVGLPDGQGALANGDGTFDLFVNHEIGSTGGIARAHGSTGAFVSRWNIGANLTVNSGRDHNTSASDVFMWNGSGYTQGTTQFNRFCSADLAAPSAYQFGGLGTSSRIFMNGEEAGDEGRAFAHVVTGASTNQSYQLPRLGRFSWENSIASPFAQQKTVVVGTDDSTPGQVYLYVGDKTDSGNDIERAGLTNGNLYGVSVQGVPAESRTTPFSGNRFSLYNHGDVSNLSGADLNASSNANGVTNFLRPEDGAWDPRPGFQNDFYFVTTDRFNNEPASAGRSRLWRMRFDDIANPLAGGQVDLLMAGTEGQQMFDNLCVDSLGRILIQEDPGNQAHLAKVWMYDITTGHRGVIAGYDPTYFAPGVPGLLTTDEESSGIIDAGSILGDGWFLMNSQAHYGIAGELVQGGQLIAMYVDPTITPAPGALALLGVGALLAGRRRR